MFELVQKVQLIGPTLKTKTKTDKSISMTWGKDKDKTNYTKELGERLVILKETASARFIVCTFMKMIHPRIFMMLIV